MQLLGCSDCSFRAIKKGAIQNLSLSPPLFIPFPDTCWVLEIWCKKEVEFRKRIELWQQKSGLLYRASWQGSLFPDYVPDCWKEGRAAHLQEETERRMGGRCCEKAQRDGYGREGKSKQLESESIERESGSSGAVAPYCLNSCVYDFKA